MLKKLEVLANIAVIITAAFLCTTLPTKYLLIAKTHTAAAAKAPMDSPFAKAPPKRSVQSGTKVSLPGDVWAQNPARLITRPELSQPDREPVIITEVKAGTNSVELNRPFDADGEWIKDISFKITNQSTKTVLYVAVDLRFTDTTTSDPAMVRPLMFGTWPGHPTPKDTTLSLKPGDSIDVSMPGQYQSLKKFLETKKSMTSINKLTITVFVVFFDDGTKWGLGNFYVPDSSRPTGFRMVDPPSGIIRRNEPNNQR